MALLIIDYIFWIGDKTYAVWLKVTLNPLHNCCSTLDLNPFFSFSCPSSSRSFFSCSVMCVWIFLVYLLLLSLPSSSITNFEDSCVSISLILSENLHLRVCLLQSVSSSSSPSSRAAFFSTASNACDRATLRPSSLCCSSTSITSKTRVWTVEKPTDLVLLRRRSADRSDDLRGCWWSKICDGGDTMGSLEMSSDVLPSSVALLDNPSFLRDPSGLEIWAFILSGSFLQRVVCSLLGKVMGGTRTRDNVVSYFTRGKRKKVIAWTIRSSTIYNEYSRKARSPVLYYHNRGAGISRHELE